MIRRGVLAGLVVTACWLGLGLGAAASQAGVVAFSSTRCGQGEDEIRPSWAPGGLGCPRRIWSVNDDGSELRRVAANHGGSVGSPNWSPDGSKIAYAAYGTMGGWAGGASRVWVVNADGTDPHPLAPPFAASAATANSPGGHYMEHGPVWSPTGRFLLLSVNGNGLSDDLVLVGADGTGYRRLTDTPELETDPSFSPDGLSILFTRRSNTLVPSDPPEMDGLYSMSMVDGRVRRVTLGPSYSFAARYSPDGRRMSYLAGKSIWTMTRFGKDVTRRTAPSPAFEWGDNVPVWAGPNALMFGAPTMTSAEDWFSVLQRLDVSRPGPSPPAQLTSIGRPPGAQMRDEDPHWHPGSPISLLAPLADPAAPEVGLVDVAAPRGARMAGTAPAGASRRTLRYTAFDQSGVSKLQVSVERKRGKRCRYLTRKGMTPRAGTCRRPRYFPVWTRTDWDSRMALLPPGTYRFRLRAWDSLGNHVRYPRPKVVRIGR